MEVNRMHVLPQPMLTESANEADQGEQDEKHRENLSELPRVVASGAREVVPDK